MENQGVDTESSTAASSLVQPTPTPPQSGFAPRRHYDAPLPGDNLPNGQASSAAAGAAASSRVQAKTKTKRDRVAEITAATNKLAIEEALKVTDSSGVAMKTPVSILQELLSRKGITPSYELVQIEGAIHEPTFRYRVCFNDKETSYTAMGAGRSKKEAKHSAARALIDKLIGTNTSLSAAERPVTQTNNAAGGTAAADGGLSTAITGCDGSSLTNSSMGCGDGADKVLGNPIGWLQEMCMSRRWPPPTYETETEDGLPHERLFTISCKILHFQESGQGKSKKIAKRLAAHKMWSFLQEKKIESSQVNEALRNELEGDNRNCSNYYGDLKDINMPMLSGSLSNKVSQFHKTLKNSTGKKLLNLQKTCLNEPNTDFSKILLEISNENHFEVTYVDIDEKTYSGNFQCLVQLSTLPVGVCHGAGDSVAAAQQNAAKNALEYLKIMTKK